MKRKKILFLILFLLILAPLFFVSAQAPCAPNQAPSTKLCNPLGGGSASVTDLKSFLIYGLTVFGSFTLVIPIMMVVFSGMSMIVAQGNAESVKRAKLAFTWTIYGFILAILSFVLVAAMIKFLGATAIQDPSNPDAIGIVNPLAEGDFGVFLKRMLNNFLAVAGILSVLMLIFNGLRYITAGGNEEQTTEAKAALKWIFSGIAVILLAYVIIRATATLFGLQ
jgi:cytochrome bd-type quinol oxidase subunit 2